MPFQRYRKPIIEERFCHTQVEDKFVPYQFNILSRSFALEVCIERYQKIM
jgi:hypothetical protein